MAKRTPTGSPRPGEQINQNNILSDVVTFTGSIVIDLKRLVRGKGAATSRKDELPFVILDVHFEDAGGAALVHRVAAQKNNDGTFTIYASQAVFTSGTPDTFVYATATNPCTVRWSALVTR